MNTNTFASWSRTFVLILSHIARSSMVCVRLCSALLFAAAAVAIAIAALTIFCAQLCCTPYVYIFVAVAFFVAELSSLLKMHINLNDRKAFVCSCRCSCTRCRLNMYAFCVSVPYNKCLFRQCHCIQSHQRLSTHQKQNYQFP